MKVVMLQGPLLADCGPSTQHSRLTSGKTREVSRQAAPDPKRTLQKRPAVLSETTSPSDKVPLTAELPAEEAEDWTVAFGQAQ
jgi:hypothetical protein